MATASKDSSKDGGVGEKDDLAPEAKPLQEAEDKAVDQGYRGIEVDPTPNENYSVDGVTSGKPTPETDPEQAAKVGSLKFR